MKIEMYVPGLKREPSYALALREIPRTRATTLCVVDAHTGEEIPFGSIAAIGKFGLKLYEGLDEFGFNRSEDESITIVQTESSCPLPVYDPNKEPEQELAYALIQGDREVQLVLVDKYTGEPIRAGIIAGLSDKGLEIKRGVNTSVDIPRGEDEAILISEEETGRYLND